MFDHIVKRGLLFDEAPGTVPATETPATPAAEVEATPEAETPDPADADFDTWLAAQPKAVQEKFAEKYGKQAAALAAERKANKENRKAAEKLAKIEAAEQKKLEAQMTKEQLLEKRATEAEAKAIEAETKSEAKLLKAAVLLKAKDLGFENPADAFILLTDKTVIKKKADGEYDEASIEAALKPLIGRLPVKTQGSGIGSALLRHSGQLPPSATAEKEKQRKEYERIVRMK